MIRLECGEGGEGLIGGKVEGLAGTGEYEEGREGGEAGLMGKGEELGFQTCTYFRLSDGNKSLELD